MATKPAPQASLPQAALVFSLLGDPTRLQMCLLLRARGEMHVAALCEATGLSQPAVSYNLMLLRRTGLVGYRREGKFNFYSLTPRGLIHKVLRLVKY